MPMVSTRVILIRSSEPGQSRKSFISACRAAFCRPRANAAEHSVRINAASGTPRCRMSIEPAPPNLIHMGMEAMMTGKLSPEGEVITAYGAAMVAAFQVLINCLEENDAVQPGQFPDALRVYMEMVKSKKGDVSDMTLAVLHDIRTATLD